MWPGIGEIVLEPPTIGFVDNCSTNLATLHPQLNLQTLLMQILKCWLSMCALKSRAIMLQTDIIIMLQYKCKTQIQLNGCHTI